MGAFLLDEDTPVRLETLLIDRGHSAIHIDTLGRKSAPDPRNFHDAAAQNLTLVTFNRRDYELLHDAWQTWTHERGVRWQHAGILILSQVQGMPPEQYADLINTLVREPGTDLDTALYNWDAATGWLHGPLPRRSKGSGAM